MEAWERNYDRWLYAPYVDAEEEEEDYFDSDDWKYEVREDDRLRDEV